MENKTIEYKNTLKELLEQKDLTFQNLMIFIFIHHLSNKYGCNVT